MGLAWPWGLGQLQPDLPTQARQKTGLPGDHHKMWKLGNFFFRSHHSSALVAKATY